MVRLILEIILEIVMTEICSRVNNARYFVFLHELLIRSYEPTSQVEQPFYHLGDHILEFLIKVVFAGGASDVVVKPVVA